VVLLFSSMSHGQVLGRGDWGSTARRQGRSTGTAMWARAYEEAIIYNKLGFTDFCPQGVRPNARMKFKFEFLKSATVGFQDIQ
jgi:hypothetical protein